MRLYWLRESATSSRLNGWQCAGGRNLASKGVFIVPMGCATNLEHFLDLIGPNGSDLRLAGWTVYLLTSNAALTRTCS